MSNNLFKNHSIDKFEKAIAIALSELLGRDVSVHIESLKATGTNDGTAEFTVTAFHRGDPDGENFGQPE